MKYLIPFLLVLISTAQAKVINLTAAQNYITNPATIGAQPGDTINITQSVSSWAIFDLTGTASNPITITASLGVEIGGYQSYSFQLYRAKHVIVKGLVIRGNIKAMGMKIQQSSDIWLDGIDVHTASVGISLKTDPIDGNPITILPVTIDNIKVTNCVVKNCGAEAYYLGHTFSPTISYGVPPPIINLYVRNCIAEGSGWDGFQITNAQNCDVSGVWVSKAARDNAPGQRSGITIQDATTGIFKDLHVDSATGSGLTIFGNGDLVYEDITINNVETGIFIDNRPDRGQGLPAKHLMMKNVTITTTRPGADYPILTYNGTNNGALAAIPGYVKNLTYTPAQWTNAIYDNVNVYSTEAPDATAPTAPQSLTATPAVNAVNLSWTAPASNGGSVITDYKIEYKKQFDEAYIVFAHTPSTATTIKVTGLTSGQLYQFRIYAINSIGTSPVSTVATATPTGSTASSWGIVSGSANPYSTEAPNQQAWVYTPANVESGKLYPAILFFSGNGERGTNINTIITTGLPQKINDGQQMESFVGAPQRTAGQDQAQSVTDFKNWMLANYPIDPNRITITGLSGGANESNYKIRAETPAAYSSAVMAAVQTSQNASGILRDRAYMVVNGDNDATYPLYQSGLTNTPVAQVTFQNNSGSNPGKFPPYLRGVKGAGHGSAAWNDWVFDKSNPTVNFEEWALRWSLDNVQQGYLNVEYLEKLITQQRWGRAFADHKAVGIAVTTLSASADKTVLTNRYNAAMAALTNLGKRYIVKLGSTVTGNYNSKPTNAAGSVSALKEFFDGSTSAIGFSVVSPTTAAGTKEYTSTLMKHVYFGMDKSIHDNGFIINGTGGVMKFTGLNNAKKYRLYVTGTDDKPVTSTPADLTVVIGTTAKYIFTGANTQDYIEFTNLTPTAGEISFEVKGTPKIISGTPALSEGGYRTTTTSNISGYEIWNSYVSTVMLVEENTAEPIPVVANAGDNQEIRLPTNSVNLDGRASTGDITSYAWSKLSGPSGGTFGTPTASTTTFTGLTSGIYVVRLTVTGSNTSTSDITITVNPALVNPNAVINPANQTITLPTSSVTLNGSTSTGSYTTINWIKKSGPAGGTITSPNALTTTVTGLQEGIYVYDLILSGEEVPSSTATATITVNPAPIPVVAKVGADQIITLPTNSVIVDGSASTGDITSYAWSKQSGPASFTITNPASAVTSVTNLVAGVYTFRLTVTGSNTSTADVKVTVNVAPAPAKAKSVTIQVNGTGTITLKGDFKIE